VVVGKRAWIVVTVCLVIVFSFIGYLFYVKSNAMESDKEMYVYRSPPSYEALSNNFLAGQELLEKRDVLVKSYTGIPFELEDVHTILMDTDRITVGKKQTQQLLDWVDRGGHLVVTPAHEDVDDDLIFKALAVGTENYIEAKNMFIEMSGISKEVEIRSFYLDRSRDSINKYKKKDGDPNVKKVEYRPLISEEGPDRLIQGPEHSAFYIEIEKGKGKVTLLADARFMYSDQLGESDHALIFWNLMTQNISGDGRHLCVLRRDEVQNLAMWIWVNATYLVLAVMLGLLVWLWSVSGRCGPIKKEIGIERRRLMEHVEASASFFWDSKQCHVLLKSVRETLKRQMSAKRPQWNHIGENELYKKCAEISGLQPKEVKQALVRDCQQEKGSVIKSILDLEIIRKKL